MEFRNTVTYSEDSNQKTNDIICIADFDQIYDLTNGEKIENLNLIIGIYKWKLFYI